MLRRYADALSNAAEDPSAATAAARGWMTWEGAITSLGAGLRPCPTPAAAATATPAQPWAARQAANGLLGVAACGAAVAAVRRD